MALFQSYTFSTVETLISDLATFAASNGWTIDSQTSTILALSKNGTVFRIERTGIGSVKLNVTPSGGTISTESITATYFDVGRPYMFVSAGNSLLIGRNHTSYGWGWGGVVYINPKTGITGGAGVIYAAAFNPIANLATANSTYYINGAWTPTTNIAGAVVGSVENDLDLVTCQPNTFNAAIMPIPITMFALHTTTTMLRPVGFLENIYRFRAGDVFVHGDTLIIDGSTYLVVAQVTQTVNESTGGRDMLIKLGA